MIAALKAIYQSSIINENNNSSRTFLSFWWYVKFLYISINFVNINENIFIQGAA